MKKFYILATMGLFAGGIVAFQSTGTYGKLEKFKTTNHMFSGGNQPGLTGAPGEANCTQCHSGSVLDGSTENQITVVNASFQTVTSYNPGETYTVTLQLASNPAKKGFSSTVLDDLNNSMAGSLSGMGIGGTVDFQNAGQTRDYVSHTASSNTSAVTLWSWNWTAPAVDAGDVTIYVAANSANDDGATSGDAIYVSTTTLGSTASVTELENDASNFTAGYSVEGHNVSVKFNSQVADDMYFNLLDMNGKSVYTYDLSKSSIGANKQTVSLPAEIKAGNYVVHFFVGNKAMSSQVAVTK